VHVRIRDGEAGDDAGRQHMAVMDETTIGGSRGRKYAELQYALKNPAGGKREVYLP
jgi:hypothetical protein